MKTSNKKTSCLSFLILLLVVSSSWADAQVYEIGKSYGLFFAVDDYENNESFGNLNNPISDVRAVSTVLRDEFNFEISLHLNTNLEEVKQILSDWRKKDFGPQDQLVVFFSGHGGYNDETGTGYFITHAPVVNAEVKYKLFDLEKDVTNIPCPHTLLAIDACHSGTINRIVSSLRFNKITRPGESDLSRQMALIDHMLRGKSRILITSAWENETPDGDKYSPFAKGILNSLQGAITTSQTRVITTYGLSADLMETVLPIPMTNTFAGHEKGGLAFIHKSIGRKIETVIATGILPPSPAIGGISRGRSPVSPTRLTQPPKVQDNSMVLIKGGSFLMGDIHGDGKPNELPLHKVDVSSFYMATTEVTINEFRKFVDATRYKTDLERSRGGSIFNGRWKVSPAYTWRTQPNGTAVSRSYENYPVTQVSRKDAARYCNYLSEKKGFKPVYIFDSDGSFRMNKNANGFRLPTEAEWEYAARNRGSNSKWPETNNQLQLASAMNIAGSRDGYTNPAPVKSYPPNKLGLYDMGGNVAEHCWDVYTEYSPERATAQMSRTRTKNYVTRGGSWFRDQTWARGSARGQSRPGGGSSMIGFRIARNKEP